MRQGLADAAIGDGNPPSQHLVSRRNSAASRFKSSSLPSTALPARGRYNVGSLTEMICASLLRMLALHPIIESGRLHAGR